VRRDAGWPRPPGFASAPGYALPAVQRPDDYFWLALLGSVLIPFIGVVLGVVWMARGFMGKGIGTAALGVVSWVIWALVAAGASLLRAFS
jgi:hypothetical protein